ncbi:D-psicose/D-tagatose/L-ribulose 3-epimerase [Allocatelliglobosispora scoriae]|uniref:D-psicose/D-tagatose/L-ribulose 3-epimerase n=1 Tax=Allocatelliglobosispora scoriae TaxID=643052 RepID=A0A841BLG1_9ACTN|nr:sugar phosphate isomerase/epimerase family protein [Allocatelliglobosispora scoriae]MBB5867701.1 D-psicose/D-tagatose/L-ribulose 3-epimerase [Allocatelliglobosispora scoriae]
MFALGVNPWVWTSPITDEALAGLVPRIAGWGFDCVELPVEQLGDWSPETTRDLLDRHGLTAATICAVTPPGRELVCTDAATVAQTQDYARALIDAAVAVGAPSVCGPLYASVGRVWRMSVEDRAACYRELRAALEPLAEYAGERGISIGIEALNRYETSVVNTVEQTLEAIDPLPGNVGIMLDSYHMNIEEADPYAAVTLAGPRLVHVQVSGSHRGAPGQDHIDWTRWLGELIGTGYTGGVCIESFTGDNEAIAVAAAIWRPLAPSQDLLATDGLAHLRKVLAELAGDRSADADRG